MNAETKICQNCKNNFVIEPEDFDFYKKIDVPPPTFCHECRFQRRLMFRNERVFYKRNCDLCGQSVVTIFAPDKPYKVFCQPCWWSDKWNAGEYATDYDPKKNFFEQYREFQKKVPYMSLINGYTSLVNSEYINHAGYAKNCYLVFNSDRCENTYYGSMVNYDKDCMDALILGDSELCYEAINCGKCYRTFFSEDCTSSTDIYFSKNLVGCNNCFGCVNLRNKSYYIFNKPYSKEDYEKEIEKFNLDSFSSIEAIKKKSREFWSKSSNKFIHGLHNVNVSGDYVYECKNANYMYQCRFVEDGKFCQWMTLAPAKDIYDLTEWGNGVQRAYDSITVGEGADNIKFCFGSWSNDLNCEYSMFVVNCSDVFGCLNLRKKQYCIFNKQYSKEEYENIKAQIIKDMSENPYIDAKGRIWKYGEFFPYDLSLFDYNESAAAQYFPISKEDAIEKGWHWRDISQGEYKITMPTEKMPDSIKNVDDSVIVGIFSCAVCAKAFRMVKGEFDLLKRFGFPLPRKCSDCRHMERLSRLNPPRLWNRKCAKCDKDIETSYAPDRPEIVYCEACYNSEVA
ncbi:MAG: hypothetical protein AAB536_03475 [Patescibacteria group bacterium]